MSLTSYSPNNYRDATSCVHCANPLMPSHRHSDNDFVIASLSRPGLMHRVMLDIRGQFHCSCEWGQARERKLRADRRAQVADCRHVAVARDLLEHEWQLMPSISDLAAAAPARLPFRQYVYSESEYELFEGDEIPAAPTAA